MSDHSRPSSARIKSKGLQALMELASNENNGLIPHVGNNGQYKPKPSYGQPTISALVKATNKLALYPEFQDLRRVVASLQVENLKTLVAEEQSHVALHSMNRKYADLQKALGLLVDTVVDEFTSLREQLGERDRRIEALTQQQTELEGQVRDLRKWASAAHEDLVELRKVMAVEVTEDSLSLRRIAAQHTDLLESLRQQQLKLQQEVGALSSNAKDALLGLHELKGRVESRARHASEGSDLALADVRHKVKALEDRLRETTARTLKVEELLVRGRAGMLG